MNGIQKIIKYLAIALALFITFNIIFGIMNCLSFFVTVFDHAEVSNEYKNLEVDNEISNLDVDIKNCNILIKMGKTFKIETNNEYIESNQVENKFLITESKKNYYTFNEDSELIIYIPKDYVFDVVNIESGAGMVEIEELYANQLYLKLGAGKVNVENLFVFDKAKVEGGAGEIKIKFSSINDLNLQMGVGKISLSSRLTGDSKIKAGVGALSLTLLNDKNDYEIEFENGLGSTTIDGKNITNDTTIGSGNNKIKLEGGLGSIKVDFK